MLAITTPRRSNRALCCDCGNVRTVGEHYRRDGDPDQSVDDNRHPDGWRMTQTLKCSICRTSTRHAVLRDHVEPRYRDIAETHQHLKPGAGVPTVGIEEWRRGRQS